MAKLVQQPWLLGVFSAGLLLLPFSIVGPVPFWRTFFAWLAFIPLLFGLLSRQNLRRRHAWLRGTLAAYVIVVEVMGFDFTFAPGPAFAAVAAGLALTVALGMIGAWRILGQKPAAFLREL